jgi:hypothetical protein
MSTAIHPSAFDAGSSAYVRGELPIDRNPYDQNVDPDEWDAWIDGWATERLNQYLEWEKIVKSKLSLLLPCLADLGECFDDLMTPDEAVEHNGRLVLIQGRD